MTAFCSQQIFDDKNNYISYNQNPYVWQLELKSCSSSIQSQSSFDGKYVQGTSMSKWDYIWFGCDGQSLRVYFILIFHLGLAISDGQAIVQEHIFLY